MAEESASDLLTLTAEIVASHVANNSVGLSDLAPLIGNVHAALAGLGAPAATLPEPAQKPAVTVRTSVKPDGITCLEDGKKFKTLKRHLRTDHGMTPDEYRAKWKLPADYPMVAPAYAETRRAMAVRIGLGRKPGQKAGRRKPVAKPG